MTIGPNWLLSADCAAGRPPQPDRARAIRLGTSPRAPGVLAENVRPMGQRTGADALAFAVVASSYHTF